MGDFGYYSYLQWMPHPSFQNRRTSSRHPNRRVSPVFPSTLPSARSQSRSTTWRWAPLAGGTDRGGAEPPWSRGRRRRRTWRRGARPSPDRELRGAPPPGRPPPPPSAAGAAPGAPPPADPNPSAAAAAAGWGRGEGAAATAAAAAATGGAGGRGAEAAVAGAHVRGTRPGGHAGAGVYSNVGLSGIRVDGQDLAIPRGTFDLRTTDGTGGVILSTTIPVTVLNPVAYGFVKAALASKIGLAPVNGSQSVGLDLCYTSQSLATRSIPAMALVFYGGAVMELQTRNYFYKDAATGLQCLSILPSPAGSVSVLGNLIQVGTHMIYDISGSKLTFESLIDTSPLSAPSLRILPVVAIDLVWVVVYLL